MERITSYTCREGFAEVSTAEGTLRGFRQNDVYTFMGIPYARAERFRQAAPLASWEGVREALDIGFSCPTPFPPTPKGDHSLPHRYFVEDEDCLNLNVWTTTLDRGAKRPVMVWLHGGGYVAGSANDLLCYDGANLAHYGEVVSVTVNHRLNVLGCLDLSEYGEEFQASGNLIMLDVVEALKWVQRNIEGFGGDPGNVTIYGQSGGGGKVTTLMQMPCADGLYHKAIVQSGIIRFNGPVEGAPMRISKEMALDMTHKIMAKAGSLENLLSMPVRELMKMSTEAIDGPMLWSPVPGAGDYPGDIGQTGGFREETKNIPTMIGNSLCEFPRFRTGRVKSEMTDDEVLDALRAVYGRHAEEIKAVFEKCYPGINPYYAVGMDMTNFRPMAKLFCEWRNRMNAAPAYQYLLTLELPYDGGTMSAHGTELPFIFHNADAIGVVNAGERTWSFQDELFYAWVNFARTGNPNHDKLPVEWKPVTKGHSFCMLFGDVSSCPEDHDTELMELMARIRS